METVFQHFSGILMDAECHFEVSGLSFWRSGGYLGRLGSNLASKLDPRGQIRESDGAIRSKMGAKIDP